MGCVRLHPTRCGYLSDYSQLNAIGNGKDLLLKTPDVESFAGIDSFYVEQVQWLADDLGQPADNEAQSAQIRAALEAALLKELGSIRPIVNTPGPNTARVRTATAVRRFKAPVKPGVHGGDDWTDLQWRGGRRV